MHISNDGGGSYITDNGEPVEMIMLDDIFGLYGLEFADVLKVDVEGGEANVILPSKLLNRFKYICVEFDNRDSIRVGELVEKISETHQIKLVGKASMGGMLYAKRY